jgi:hypothetical protein
MEYDSPCEMEDFNHGDASSPGGEKKRCLLNP